MSQIELSIRCQSGNREVRRADDGENRAKAIEQHLLPRPVGIKKPTFGVKKAFVMQTHLNGLALQVSDQVLNQTQRLFIEWQLLQISSDQPSDDRCIRPQSELFSRCRFSAEQEPKVSESPQALLD